jgi:hypothetical protein
MGGGKTAQKGNIMKRQDKYPDTKTFHFYNANPKGKFTTDCTIRAICTALEIPYEQVIMEMAKMECETGYNRSSNEGINQYLESKGWKKNKQPRKLDNTKYTGEDLCEQIHEGLHINNEPLNRLIANIGGGHIVAIIDGKVWDTWDSTDGCIGNYWTKG